jgi:hypothetical protein
LDGASTDGGETEVEVERTDAELTARRVMKRLRSTYFSRRNDGFGWLTTHARSVAAYQSLRVQSKFGLTSEAHADVGAQGVLLRVPRDFTLIGE